MFTQYPPRSRQLLMDECQSEMVFLLEEIAEAKSWNEKDISGIDLIPHTPLKKAIRKSPTP